MSPEVEDAIESARTVGKGGDSGKRPYAFDFIAHIVLCVIRELPEDMSVRDLREELEE
jgi:hypothetical protein